MTPADRIVAEQDRLARIGARTAASIGIRARAAAIKALRSGGPLNVGPAIRPILTEAYPLIQEGLVSGFLTGAVRARQNARLHIQRPRRFARVYDEAIDNLTRRLDITDQYRALLVRRFSVEAVTATNTLVGNVEREVLAAVQDSIARGLTVRDGTAAIRRAFDAAGVTTANNNLFETVFRTEVAKTYTAGRLSVNATPQIQEILWGYEYSTVGDDRVRPAHQAMDGTKLPKAHPFWRQNMPPNGWNCRCTVFEVYNDESPTPIDPPADFVFDGQPVDPVADRGFDVDWSALTASLPNP